MKFSRESLKGNLTILLLASVEDRPRHAYEIITWLNDESLKLLELSEGTVYPSLHRLERDGLLLSEVEPRDDKRVIRRYHLTTKGKKELERGRREWRFFRQAVDLILNRSELHSQQMNDGKPSPPA